MSILVNDGVRKPMVSLTRLHFAANTPFDTRLSIKPAKGEQMLPPELTQVVRRALAGVVQNGTASRLAGALKDAAGNPLTIGGKTGTGDHRFQRFGRGGQLLESRVVNRTATFAFYLGDRYFGTLTALVPGEQAGQFVFTSSLTTQILKTLLPKLQPYLYPLPTEPAQPDPVATDKPAVVKGPAAASKPTQEAPDDTRSKVDIPAPEPEPATGGFPEDLDAGLTARPTAPTPTPTPAIRPPSPAPVVPPRPAAGAPAATELPATPAPDSPPVDPAP